MTEPVAAADLHPGLAAGISFLRRRADDASRSLMLLHGIGSNAASFTALMSALPASVDAVAWSAPGYGASERLSANAPQPRDYADALERFLDTLNLERVALVGHSLGALFAASFAATRPARVSALALISPALGYRTAPDAPLPESVQARIDDLATLGPERFAKSRAERLVGDPQARPDIVAAVRQAMASLNPLGYSQAVRALGSGDLCADIACARAPALVAVGTADRITPPANARTAHAAFGKGLADFHEVAGGGHALPQEQPDAVAQLIVGLLKRSTDA